MNLKMKKMARDYGRRIISCALVIALTLGLIPDTAFAGKADNMPAKTENEYISGDCTIQYDEISTWDKTVNATVTITNNGDENIEPWSIFMDYDGKPAHQAVCGFSLFRTFG